jgi:tetrahydromethanopterin S-methyltransferase subunit E
MCDIMQSCENTNIQGNSNIILFCIVIVSYFLISLMLLFIEKHNKSFHNYIPVATHDE